MPRGRPRKNPDAAPAPKKTTKVSKAKAATATLGFEQQMFLAADKLRKNLEPSDGFVAQIPTKDSLFEFSLLAGYDEQAKTHALPNDQLVLLQRSAEEAWVSDGVV